MSKKRPSVRFLQHHEIRELLGLNKGKLPTDERHFTIGGLHFHLLASSQVLRTPRSRPHRLLIECSVCNKWMSAGRFNQHQAIHPRESLSELSKVFLEGRTL